MEPSVSIDSLSSSLWVLVVTKHHIHTLTDDFACNVVWVWTVNLNFHAWHLLSARTLSEVFPVFVADDRSALSHSVTNCDREVDTSEEVANLFVERSAAYNNFVDIATERLEDLLANLAVNDVAETWYAEHELHARSLEEREYASAYDLLNDERHCNQ